MQAGTLCTFGNRKDVSFWNDKWSSEIPIRYHFPNLYAIVVNKTHQWLITCAIDSAALELRCQRLAEGCGDSRTSLVFGGLRATSVSRT